MLLRLLSDGSPDPGFGSGGEIIADFAPGSRDRIIDLQSGPDDSVVAVGGPSRTRTGTSTARFDQGRRAGSDVRGRRVGLISTSSVDRPTRSTTSPVPEEKILPPARPAVWQASPAIWLVDGRLDRTFGEMATSGEGRTLR